MFILAQFIFAYKFYMIKVVVERLECIKKFLVKIVESK